MESDRMKNEGSQEKLQKARAPGCVWLVGWLRTKGWGAWKEARWKHPHGHSADVLSVAQQMCKNFITYKEPLYQ